MRNSAFMKSVQLPELAFTQSIKYHVQPAHNMSVKSWKNFPKCAKGEYKDWLKTHSWGLYYINCEVHY